MRTYWQVRPISKHFVSEGPHRYECVSATLNLIDLKFHFCLLTKKSLCPESKLAIWGCGFKSKSTGILHPCITVILQRLVLAKSRLLLRDPIKSLNSLIKSRSHNLFQSEICHITEAKDAITSVSLDILIIVKDNKSRTKQGNHFNLNVQNNQIEITVLK